MKIDPNISQELRRFFKKKIANSPEKVIIVSAYELSVEEKQVLSTWLNEFSQNINIDYRVEKNILAGIIIKIQSTIVDLSLKGRLENLKHDLYESA